ncbi:MAG: TetR/AcrR family transcriptional regulator, partial [Candidatus Ornithospirochaeta sp.]
DIVDGAFDLVRSEGIGRLNARSLARRLSVSTQPILYHFSTMEDLKKEVFRKTDDYHSSYIFSCVTGSDDPFRSLGLGYIRFAREERNLFLFLFQSDNYRGSFMSLFEDEALLPVLRLMTGQDDVDQEKARASFLPRFLMVHGIASLVANNSLEYDEEEFGKILDRGRR